MSFRDQTLLRLLDDPFVTGLFSGVGAVDLTALFRQVYSLEEIELKQVALREISGREMEMATFETLHTRGRHERLAGGPDTIRIDREQPRRGRLAWIDALVRLVVDATVIDPATPLKEIRVTDLLDELGDPPDMASLEAALVARFGQTVTDEALRKFRISSLESFRRLGSRFLQFVGEPTPADPTRVQPFTLRVCVRIEGDLAPVDALRETKLARAILEAEHPRSGVSAGIEEKRSFAFLVLHPKPAAGTTPLPGFSAVDFETKCRALFANEDLAAHFVTPLA